MSDKVSDKVRGILNKSKRQSLSNPMGEGRGEGGRHLCGLVRFLASLACVLLGGCSKETPSGAAAPVSPLPAEMVSRIAYDASVPREGDVPGYTGSKSCRPCHEDQYTSWHRSYHRTMTQVASPEAVQADFHGVVLTNETIRFRLSEKAGEFWVRMEHAASENPAPADAVETRVGLVTGSHHMQVFWVAGGAGNTQIGFPFTWLIPEKRWVPRNSTFVRPPDMPHRSEVWNIVCSRCHATGTEPRVDTARRSADTRAGELGIACEACHGPGQKHTEARLVAKAKADPRALPIALNEIVHPEKLEPARASQVCGFCHSMKWFDKSEGWPRNGFRYRPGDDLEATTPIIRPSRVKELPQLAGYLEQNPDLLRDFFWPDGMIRVSGREYNGLIDSPCYQGGKFSCLSCHSLHSSKPEGLVAQKAKGNGACTQCHERLRSADAVAAHTRHRPDSSGSECYNCHMPFTTYGVLKAIRSHQVSSPSVADDLATGRPNACNLCHLDKTLGWTASHLRAWHGQKEPPLAPGSNETSHALRLAITGDAGQRALLAWHFSWPPALQVSGTNWIQPALGQLLDDPYAAVRCVAERSLRSIAKSTPADYDYTRDPRSRPPAREKVWESWRRSEPAGAEPEAAGMPSRHENLGALRDRFEFWLGARNDRPVRLRE